MSIACTGFGIGTVSNFIYILAVAGYRLNPKVAKVGNAATIRCLPHHLVGVILCVKNSCKLQAFLVRPTNKTLRLLLSYTFCILQLADSSYRLTVI